MPTCTPFLGLGVRRIQYLLLAMAITLEFWIQEFTYGVFFANNSDPERRLSQQSPTPEQMSKLETIAYLMFSVGRLFSGFLCVKTTSKYILVAGVATEIIVLTSCYFFAKIMGFKLLAFCMTIVATLRSFHWTMSLNILSKWTPYNELTSAMALICVSRDCLAFLNFNVVSRLSYEASLVILVSLIIVYTVWLVLFLIFGADGPDTSFLISKSEYHHLAKIIGPRKKANCSSTLPLKSFAKTIILYGWVIADFGRECAVKAVGHVFPIGISIHPYSSVAAVQIALLFVFASILATAIMSDKLVITKGLLTAGQVRKIYSSVGCCGISISMILAAYSVNQSTSNTFLLVGYVFGCVINMGQPVSLFDLSPNYAAPLFSILTFFRLIMVAAKIYIDTRLGIYPVTVANMKETYDANLYRYGFLVFITNLIFLLCGDIVKKQFDSKDTYDWTKESIISYP